MADRYWAGGTGTWNTSSTANWSAASPVTFIASCTGTTLTTTGSPALVAGMTVWSSTSVSLGTVVSGAVNTWVVSVGGTYSSQAMQAATIGASVPTAADSVIFEPAFTYTVTCTGALTCLDITVSAGIVTFATGTTPTFAISGSMSLVAATVWSATGAITFNATATGKTIITNGVSLNISTTRTITFNGVGGGWTLGSALTTTGIVTFTNGTFSTGNFAVSAITYTNSGTGTNSISLGSSAITVTGGVSPWGFGLVTGLTFNAGTSTITLSSTNADMSGGGLTYYNVIFSSTSGGASITGVNTFNNLTIAGPLTFNAAQTVNGTLNITGVSQAQRVYITSGTFGSAVTITTAAVSIANVNFRDIATAGAAGTWTGSSIGDSYGNTGITFTAAKTVYWNLAGSQNWSSTGWCTASGGTPAIANFPLPQDTAVIDQNSAITTLTITSSLQISTVDMSLRTSAMTLSIGSFIEAYGSWKNGTGVTISGTAVLSFLGRTTQQITSNGVAFTQPITINNLTGTFQLQDAFTTASTVTTTLTTGTLDLNGKTFTTGLFSSTANTRALAFGVGNIVCSGTGTVWTTATVTGLTISGTPVVNVTSTGATAITVLPGALSQASAISFNFTGGTYALTFLGTASYTAKSVNFTGYAGTWGATSTATIYGDLTLSTGMTLTTSASAMTFGATSGTQTITSNTKTMDFPITINGNSATTITCADALTLGSTRALTFSLGTLQLKSSATSTVGSFVTSGTTLKYLQSTTSGTQATISAASGTNTATYLSIQDSAATGGATWTATAGTNVDAGNNTGWTFASVSSGNFFLMFD
jgi:hypothetical protein